MNNSTRPIGRFITLEGIEGAGKSTAMSFIEKQLHRLEIPHVMTREPGGTHVSEAIRTVLLNQYKDEVMSPDAELLLLFAARAQHLAQLILPTLRSGCWVICDRFTDASFAYQGGGRGISLDRIDRLTSWMEEYVEPDMTLLLDLPVELGLSRVRKRGAGDRIEQESHTFFTRVREHYLMRAAQFPKRFRVIAADRRIADVEKDMMRALTPLIQKT